jgi:hypothetical protein
MKEHVKALSYFQRDQLLEFFFHHLSMEDRGKLMNTLPAAYNAWCGREIVRVIQTCDGLPAAADRVAIVTIGAAAPAA